MDDIMLDLQAMKDTLIAIERETYNITAIKWNGETPQHNTVRHKANPPCNSHTSLVKRHSSVVASNTITDINPSLKPICNTLHCKASPP